MPVITIGVSSNQTAPDNVSGSWISYITGIEVRILEFWDGCLSHHRRNETDSFEQRKI